MELNLYYRIHKSQPPALILSQINTVHGLATDFF